MDCPGSMQTFRSYIPRGINVSWFHDRLYMSISFYRHHQTIYIRLFCNYYICILFIYTLYSVYIYIYTIYIMYIYIYTCLRYSAGIPCGADVLSNQVEPKIVKAEPVDKRQKAGGKQYRNRVPAGL